MLSFIDLVFVVVWFVLFPSVVVLVFVCLFVFLTREGLSAIFWILNIDFNIYRKEGLY